MSAVFILIGASLLVASGFLIAFLWAVKSGQYEDKYTPSIRMLFEEKNKLSNSDSNQNKGDAKHSSWNFQLWQQDRSKFCSRDGYLGYDWDAGRGVDRFSDLYSGAEFDILSLDTFLSSFYVEGAAIGQKLDIDSSYGWPTIEHNNQIILDTLGPATSSLTIIVEHWEEEY